VFLCNRALFRKGERMEGAPFGMESLVRAMGGGDEVF